MLVYGECECFVMQMLYVCVLCASCGSSQCCVLHDFTVFICFIAWITSCSVGTPVAISRSSLGAGGSAVMVGASVLRTSFGLHLFCG